LAELKDSERFRLPIESELYLQLYRPVLPGVDRGHLTKLGCLLSLGAAWLAILGCLISPIFITALAIFATHPLVRKPKGPQPVAWGHFLTLTDLIDDRSLDPAGKLWWGNKGVSDDGIRHAGMSMTKEELGDIMMMDAVYAGR
jgi:hypothetical protein